MAALIGPDDMIAPLTISLVTPNWNGAQFLERTPVSVLDQEVDAPVIAVDPRSVVWRSGPNFSRSALVGLEARVRSQMTTSQQQPATPVLAGPVARYDFGAGRFRVEEPATPFFDNDAHVVHFTVDGLTRAPHEFGQDHIEFVKDSLWPGLLSMPVLLDQLSTTRAPDRNSPNVPA